MKSIKTLKIIVVFAIALGLNIGVSVIGTNFPWYVSVILAEASIVIPTLAFVKFEEGKLGDIIRFKKVKASTIGKTFLVTIAVTPVYMFANLLSQLFVPNTMAQASNNMFAGSAILPFIMTCIAAPVCEEIGCRGVFMNEFKTVTRTWVAVIISAAMFGALHLNLNQFCYALVLGIVFAAVNEASGSIITSIMMHFLVNLFGTTILYVQQLASKASGTDFAQSAEALRESGAIAAAIPFYGILAAIGVAVMIPLIKSIAKKEKEEE